MHPVRGAKNREMENDSETRSRTASRSGRTDGRPTPSRTNGNGPRWPRSGRTHRRKGQHRRSAPAPRHAPQTATRPADPGERTDKPEPSRTNGELFHFSRRGKTWKINHRESCRIADQTDKNAKRQNQRQKMKSRTSPGTSTAADPPPATKTAAFSA